MKRVEKAIIKVKKLSIKLLFSTLYINRFILRRVQILYNMKSAEHNINIFLGLSHVVSTFERE